MDPEQLVHDHAERMAQQMQGIARSARSEEDVRHEANKLIDAFIAEAGIKVRGRHEYGLAGGRVDSKYGGVIIEYKSPHGASKIGATADAPGTRAAVKQIQRRFRDLQKTEHVGAERVLGVACDGSRIVFVRRRGRKFDVQPPQPLTPHSVERLLRALLSVGAQGLSFTPDQLATAFGFESDLAQVGVRTMYDVVTETEDPKAHTLFNQWKILFGEVCGYDVEGRSPKMEKLGDHYGVETAQPAALLFSLHTYYAIFMKFLAAEIAASFSPLGASVLKRCLAAPTSEALRDEMSTLEEGGIWAQLGISNFLEGDLFSWYLSTWDDRTASVVRGVVERLDTFDPTTLSVEPAESRDLLKRLYQNLFPKSVRHDLGEYYTPDWLAELVLNELTYDGDPDKRLLDPACGSGTFLVMAINRIKAWFEEHRHDCGFREDELVRKILRNIIGFDLNPLAVMAARTNYLLAIRDLLRHAPSVELPVYLCDSIMTPAEYGGLFAGEAADRRVIKTSAGEFQIPTDVAQSRQQMARYADALDFCVRDDYSAEEFLAHCKAKGIPVKAAELHTGLYSQLRELHGQKRNRIWARIIKNAFAPLFIGRVDYVAGNPPWVNWASLPEDYRDAQKPLWRDYGLFTLSGSEGRLGGGKKDLAMLFAYASVDNYLRPGGRLGFLITQSVFKTKGAGDGFRRFTFDAPSGTVTLRPLLVHDLSPLQVFEGATNRTALLLCERGDAPTDYPVRYVQWAGPSRVPQDSSLAEVLRSTTRTECGAVPSSLASPTSPWLTAPVAALPAIRRVMGRSDYQAYGSCCTWLNGVYWVRPLEELPDGALLIENLHDVGKIKVQRVEAAVEPHLVYPLVRGRDVSRWRASPSVHVLLAQDPATRRGIPEADMKSQYPRAFAYLRMFEEALRRRSGYRRYYKPADPFYSMYNVGPYTLAEWKVVWAGEVATRLDAAVVGTESGSRPAITDQTAYQLPCPSADEAFFVCGLLNSSPIRAYYRFVAYKHTSMNFIRDLALPPFDRSAHHRIAALSRECHKAAAAEDPDALPTLERELDGLAADLWGIADAELGAVQDALSEQVEGV